MSYYDRTARYLVLTVVILLFLVTVYITFLMPHNTGPAPSSVPSPGQVAPFIR